MTHITYKKIVDLKVGDWNVNIFGVVKYFRPPIIITKTGQYHMMVTIIDQSVEENIENGIRCILFDNEDKLPKVNKVGDIIMLKGVQVKLFADKLQLQKTNNYQWIVYGTEEKSDNKFCTNRKNSSCPPPTIIYHDEGRVSNLLRFLYRVKSKMIDSENIIIDNLDLKMTLLSDLKPDTYVNVLVQVIDINKFESSASASSKSLLLSVSDGSKTLYNSLYRVAKVSPTEDSNFVKATRDALYHISVFDDHVDEAGKLKVGDIIMVINLHVKSVRKTLGDKVAEEIKLQQHDDRSGWIELIVHSGTKFGRSIKVVANDDPSVLTLNERITKMTNIYDAKMIIDEVLKTVVQADIDQSENMDVQPSVNEEHDLDEQPCCLQESLTSIDFPLKPLTSISFIKGYQGDANKFRLRGKVLSIKPTHLKDIIINICEKCNLFTKPIEPYDDVVLLCPQCKEESLKLTYLFRLLVEDQTGIIEIISYGDEAFYFFKNTAPIVLLRDRLVMSDFEEKLCKFDNVDDDTDDLQMALLPSIDLCIFICKTNTGLKYRMFGTSLL